MTVPPATADLDLAAFDWDVRSHIRVLLVEDNQDHRMLMARRLRDAGMTVREAATAEAALGELDEVDLVLLDYRLPRMNGLELLAMLRDRVGAPSVIVVTGVMSTELVIEAMRHGAIDYIVKEEGYLDSVVPVVERAWRQHDLARRTRELQRLAVLVQGATARDEVVGQIVRGAARLFRAAAAGLAVHDHGEPVVRAVIGDRSAVEEVLADASRVAGTTAVEQPRSDCVIIGLADEDDDGAAIVLADRRDERGLEPDELELAEAYAAFSAVALRNLRRRELEQALIDELQETMRARRDFIASVSHELRTPLTSIGGYTETILTHWMRLSDDQKRDFLKRIHRHTDELTDLIEQLMDLAELERGRSLGAAAEEELVLGDAVRETVRSLENLLDPRDLTVEVPAVAVRADAILLHRVLSNLLSNAAKYSEHDAPIAVTARREGPVVRVEVTDEGTGIEETELAHVFEPFWRAGRSVTAAVRGSGIGLSLVREYVQAMGGEIGVESVVGAGSTFWFTLPAAAAADVTDGTE